MNSTGVFIQGRKTRASRVHNPPISFVRIRQTFMLFHQEGDAREPTRPRGLHVPGLLILTHNNLKEGITSGTAWCVGQKDGMRFKVPRTRTIQPRRSLT